MAQIGTEITYKKLCKFIIISHVIILSKILNPFMQITMTADTICHKYKLTIKHVKFI